MDPETIGAALDFGMLTVAKDVVDLGSHFYDAAMALKQGVK